MRTKLLNLIGLFALAAAALHGQPTNGPVYWSITQPDCSSLSESPMAILNSSGATIGYSCWVSGTFVWLAAGGGWGSAIRVSAPFSAPVGVDYTFYDLSGNNLAVDSTASASLAVASYATNDVNFALAANQPSEIDLLGATGSGPGYANTTVGSAYAVFYCPDANTCLNVLPQLLYSNLPNKPWLLSVPIAFDTLVWTQWSAVGIDETSTSGPHRVSYVIYNEDVSPATYKVTVYDSTGKLVGTGTTPSVPPLQSLGNNTYGEGGVTSGQLAALVPNLPSGTFKVYFDGGTLNSAVQVLQFYGPAASSLQVAYDGPSTSTTAPTLRPAAAPSRQSSVRARIESMPKPGFGPLPK